MATSDATTPLRVGLNLLFLGERAGGVGRYAAELPPALLAAEPETRITVFASPSLPAAVRSAEWARQVRWITVPGAGGGAALQAAQFLALPAVARAQGLDVLHSPANIGPGLTPGVASAVSLMDLIWLHHADDWNPDPRAQRAMRRWVGISLRHADAVLTISEAARDEIERDLGVTTMRLAVTPLGVRRPSTDAGAAAQERVREGLHLRPAERVLMCVAQKRRYKNLTALVEVLPELAPDVVLVLPGAHTAYEDELVATARRLGVVDRLRRPGWVSEEQLTALYAIAELVVLPTLAEGFGLPVLEAMAHGAPVACSDIRVLREVAGDAAAYFDPYDRESLRACLTDLLADAAARRGLAQRGCRRVTEFSWTRTGRTTLAAYRRAIANHYARRR